MMTENPHMQQQKSWIYLRWKTISQVVVHFIQILSSEMGNLYNVVSVWYRVVEAITLCLVVDLTIIILCMFEFKRREIYRTSRQSDVASIIATCTFTHSRRSSRMKHVTNIKSVKDVEVHFITLSTLRRCCFWCSMLWSIEPGKWGGLWMIINYSWKSGTQFLIMHC